MIWSFEKARPFWSQMTNFIATLFDLPNISNPEWCILGIFEGLDLRATWK